MWVFSGHKILSTTLPARSRCYAGLEALNSILTLDERALYQKRFEENCGLGDALYKAWFTLKSEVMAEDSLCKSKIREISTNKQIHLRWLAENFSKTHLKKTTKSLTRNNKQRLPLNLSSDEAIKCLEEKLEKRAEEKH